MEHVAYGNSADIIWFHTPGQVSATAIVSRLCHELQVRRDGTVVAWGDPVRGGDVTPVFSKLKQGASWALVFPIQGDVKNVYAEWALLWRNTIKALPVIL